MTRWLAVCLIAVLTITGTCWRPAPARAQGAGSVLEEILDILEKGGQITEAKKRELLQRALQETKQSEAARQKSIQEATAILAAGIENYKPFIRSADGNLRLELGGRVQANYAATEDDATTLAGADLTDRFLIRRARLDANLALFKWILMRVEGEFTEANVSLKDAYIDFTARPFFAVRTGQFKQPFSREELFSDNLTDFVERSVINELSPSRDIGAMAFGSLFDRIVSYQVSVYNGAGEDAADNNDSKDMAGRLVLAPFRTTSLGPLKNLEVGGNFTWGDEDGVLSAQGRTTARATNRFVYFAAQPTRGERLRYGADLGWSWGPLGLGFEWAEQRNERHRCTVITGTGSSALCAGGPDRADLVARGWHLYGTWLITGETKILGAPLIPKRNFSPFTGNWGPGAWQLGVRYATLDFSSDDPVDFFDGNPTNGVPGGGTTAENGVEALTIGLNWYFNPRVRAMVNWTQYWFDNDLGTPFSCKRPACNQTQLEHGGEEFEIETSVQVWF